MDYPKQIKDLIESFQSLPSIGKKSAERLALYALTEMSEENINKLSYSLAAIRSELTFCPHCHNVSSNDELCEICKDSNRDKHTIMVVESIKDLFTMEKMNSYKGMYHVLGGAINLSIGIGVDDININDLIKRIDEEEIKEVILATNATTEGETTARYIKILLEDKDVIVTRIAHGLPFGGDISYADELTLLQAIEGRRKY
jgi:recombination protein RecR